MNKKIKEKKGTGKQRNIDNDKPVLYQAIGRRKEATARVKLYVLGKETIKVWNKSIKKGEILVNRKNIKDYFQRDLDSKFYLEPFRTTNTIGRFAVSALIKGGGLSGQMDAFIHGVARALEKVDKERFRSILKKRGYLTRDARVKERRKAGYAQKARARKQSPKR